jgi:hypothetical protein
MSLASASHAFSSVQQHSSNNDDIHVYTPNADQAETAFIGGTTSSPSKGKQKATESDDAHDDTEADDSSNDPRHMLRAQLRKTRALSPAGKRSSAVLFLSKVCKS